jgi:hypothetical protein
MIADRNLTLIPNHNLTPTPNQFWEAGEVEGEVAVEGEGARDV